MPKLKNQPSLFLVSILIFSSLLASTISHAQVFSFASSCEPLTGDSIVVDAFQKQCIASWNSLSGQPSFFTTKAVSDAALLYDQEAIRLSKAFDHCSIYNIRLLAKTSKLSASQLELIFSNQGADPFKIKISLANVTSHAWVQLFSHGIQLPHNFETLDLVFKGKGNSILVDQMEITSECVPSLQIGQATGRVATADEATFSPVTINQNDTLLVSATSDILLAGELVFKEGSEVTLQIDSCKAKKKKCEEGTLSTKEPKSSPKNLVVYNFLSPNGDGQNDTFYIENLETFPDVELTIASKTGKVVYHTRSYQNDWDGGNESRGIYTYQLRLKEGEKPLKGELLLER